MAYRNAVATNTAVAAGTPFDFSITTPTIVAGDRLLCLIEIDSATIAIDSVPSGWALIDSAASASPDGCSYFLYEKKVASGSEGASQTWSADGSPSSDVMGIMASWSGRHDTNALTFATETHNTSSNTTPISLSGASGTAASGDDVALFIGYDQTVGTDTWGTASYSSSLTERVDNSSGSWNSGALATVDAVSAGAFGTVTCTGTRATGTGNAGYVMYVVAIPAAAGGGSGVSMAWMTA